MMDGLQAYTNNAAFLTSFIVPSGDLAANMMTQYATLGGAVSQGVITALQGGISSSSRALSPFLGNLTTLASTADGNGVVRLLGNETFVQTVEMTRGLPADAFSQVRMASQKMLRAGPEHLLGLGNPVGDSFAQALDVIAQQCARGDVSSPSGVVISVYGGRVYVGREVPLTALSSVVERERGDAAVRDFVGVLLSRAKDGTLRYVSMAAGVESTGTARVGGRSQSGNGSVGYSLAAVGRGFDDIVAGSRDSDVDQALKLIYEGVIPQEGDVLWITGGDNAVEFQDGRVVMAGDVVLSRVIPERWDSQSRTENRKNRQFIKVPCVYHDGKIVVRLCAVRGPNKEIFLHLLVRAGWGLAFDTSVLKKSQRNSGTSERERAIAAAEEYLAGDGYTKVELPFDLAVQLDGNIARAMGLKRTIRPEG